MAIGDTVNAGLMRIDSSPLLRAGEANAQANQAFGDAVGNFVDGYYKKKKEKEDRQERESFFISQGFTDEEAKAASGDQNLAKFLEAKRNADRTFKFEKQKQGLLKRQYADREEALDRDRISKEKLDSFLLTRPSIPIDDPRFVKPLTDPDPDGPPIMPQRGQAPALASLTGPFAEIGKQIQQGYESGEFPAEKAIEAIGGLQARQDAQAPKPLSVSDQIKILEFNEKNEPKPPPEDVYMQAALDAIDISLALIEKDSTFNPTAGFGAELMTNFGASDATTLEQALKTITSAIGFTRLEDMRKASPTGGALGQVSERELDQLNASLGSIYQFQKPEQLRENLIKIRKQYQSSVDALAAQKYAFDNGLKFKNPKQALDFIKQYKQLGQASAQASAQSSPPSAIRIGKDGEFTPIKD